MGFRLSDYYAMVRDFFVKRVKRRFIFFTVATYWAGLACFLIPYTAMSESVDHKGRILGVYDIGFAVQMCFVMINHLNFMTTIRDWSRPMRIFVTITWVLYLVIIVAASNVPGGSDNFY